MMFVPKSSLDLGSFSKWVSNVKPLSLKEVLHLRDGQELPKKGFSKSIAQTTSSKFGYYGLVKISLN